MLMDLLELGAVLLIVAELVAVVPIWVAMFPLCRLHGDGTSHDTC